MKKTLSLLFLLCALCLGVKAQSYPFEFSTSKDAADAKWYSIQFRNLNGNTYAYVDNDASTKLGQIKTNDAKFATLTFDQKAFCFVKNGEGFYIYNKGTGKGVKVDAVTDRAPVKVADAPTLIKYRANNSDHFLYDGEFRENINNTLCSWSNQDDFIAISAASSRTNYNGARAVFTLMAEPQDYTISCTGLTGGETGGVIYKCVNYTDKLSVGDFDADALLAMHVSGYNGTATVDVESKTISVSYNKDYSATSVLWDGNGDVNNTKVPAARIPAMVRASNGDILAFADWRYSRDDVGRSTFNLGYEVDIEMRRSKDGGKTWSPAIVAANGDGGNIRTTAGYGDASVVADSESGKVLLMCVNADGSNRFVRFTSDDFGETWSAPQNIASAIAPEAPGCVFFTSGKMVQSRDFKKTGADHKRIYAPICGGTSDYVLYSDDFGMTWHRLGTTAAQTGTNNECRLVELPNGDLLLDSRAGNVRKFNVFTFTNRENATGSWGTQNTDGDMPTVDCNGDIDLVQGYAPGAGKPVNILLQSLPRGGNNGATRAHVQYYYKVLSDGHYTLDDLKSGWVAGLEVCAGKSAYSSTIHLADGSQAILYEKAHAESETGYNGNPWGYDIKFETHTLAEITKNAYLTEPAKAVTINYTLTDNAGNEYVGSYDSVEGTLPTFTGIDGVNVVDAVWGEVVGNVQSLTGNLEFPFLVSSAEKHNFYHITAYEANAHYWYAKENGQVAVTKDNTPGLNAEYDWAFFPFLDGEKFTVRIMNKLYSKFISTSSTTNNHDNGSVVLAEEGTAFTFDGSHQFGTTLSPMKYLSVNSSTYVPEQSVGTWDSHKGTPVTLTFCASVLTDIQQFATSSLLPSTSSLYDLQGRRLVAPQKGINIVNGQKILVK